MSKLRAVFLGSVILGSVAFGRVYGQLESPDSAWPQWRGPAATGDAGEGDFPVEWSSEKNVRWRSKVPGHGLSSPIIMGDKIVVTSAVPIGPELTPRFSGRPGAHDNLPVNSKHQFLVLGFDLKTGEQRWATVVNEALPLEGGHQSASLASGSCVTDGNLVIAYFGSHGLYCLDSNGKILWEKDLGRMHSKHGHGEGASPALHGDHVIVNWDHEEQSFLVALNKKTGQEIWRRQRDEVTSWSTPIVIDSDGVEQVIVAGTSRVRSYELKTGKVLWECGGMSANIVATPVFKDGILIVGSSYEKRIMMAIRVAGAQGDITNSDHVIWSRTRGTPYVPSMLLVDDGVYFLAHYQNILTRVEVATGKEAPGPMRLGSLGSIYSSPVAGGDNVYVTDLQGNTMVIRKGSSPKPVSVNRLGEPVSATLAFAEDCIFIRGLEHLYCIAKNAN